MHRPGDIIDERYLLVKLLGLRGGAEMWEAEHEVVGRKVTLKFMPGNLDTDPELQTLLVGEARASSAIGHPAVVEVYDVGATPHGEAYLVTEMLRGETLADLIARKGWLKPADACLIARELLSGLEAAHAAGVVHGQLRPDAIVLRNDSLGHVNIKILEFRMGQSAADRKAVKAISGSPNSSNDVLETSVNRPRFGLASQLHKDELSPYSAPEQVLSPPSDPRSDVYSVGVMLFEMLTGRVPDMDSPASEPNPEDHLAPSAHPPVPAALQKVIDVAVASAPERRFGSARDMEDALEPFISDGSSTVPLRESMMPLLSSEARRSRAMARLERAVLGVDGASHAPPANGRANVVVIDSARRLSVAAAAGIATSTAPRERLGERSRETSEALVRTKAEPPARGYPPDFVDDVKVPPAPRTPACLEPFHHSPSSSSGMRRGGRPTPDRARKGTGMVRSSGRRRALASPNRAAPPWKVALLLVTAFLVGGWITHWMHW